MSGLVVNVVTRSKYGDTTMPTTSVTATTSTDRMHMITNSAFFGRFTDLVGLACLSFSSAISPLSPGILPSRRMIAVGVASDGPMVVKTPAGWGLLS